MNPLATNHLSPYQRANVLGLDVSLFRDDRPLLDALRAVGTLPRQNVAGQYDVGGGIGLRDVLGAMSSDPQITAGANLLAEVAPGSGNILAAQRIPTMYEAFKEAQNPIARTLRGAELGLEGLGAVGDFVPGLAMAGAAGAGLFGMMARNTDQLPPLANALRGQRGIIGSTGAKTADLEALEAAKRMKADGSPADNIYAATGWWLDHPDGRPRFEIDDSGAQWGEGFYDYATDGKRLHRSSNFVDHPELFKAYPELEKTGVLVGDLGRASGNYGMDDLITLNKDSFGKEDMLSVFLHEAQHGGPQRLDDLARGGSPDTGLGINLPIGWRNDSQQAANLAIKIKKWRGKYDKVLADELGKYPPNIVRSAESMAEQPIGTLRELGGDPDYEAYRRLAGESEARLVQQRMNLTPAERAANPFYREFDVPLEDQIVRMEDGTMQAVGLPPMPGETDIPDGMVRRYHVTRPENVGNIKSNGLSMESARGIEGPKAIYGWGNIKDAESYAAGNGSIVEYWMNPDDLISGTYSAADIPANQITAIHEPWQSHLRYAVENNLSVDDLRGIDADYEKAADALESMQPLPTDTASRMQRAREGGFGEQDFFRGDGEKVSEFDDYLLGSNTGADDANIGWHFSDNRGDAGLYADMAGKKRAEKITEDNALNGVFESVDESGHVGQYRLKMENPLIVGLDDAEGNAGPMTQEFLHNKIAAKEYAVANGHDAIIYPYGTNVDSGYTAIVFEPNQIRSVDAQFDPAKRNSADLLAGGVGGLALADQRQQQVEAHRKRIYDQMKANRQ